MKTIEFAGFTCRLEYRTYASGNVRLELLDAADGCPVAVCTCDPGQRLAPDLVAIKDWSENAGMTECLLSAGVIGDCVDYLPSGYVVIGVHQLLISAEEWAALETLASAHDLGALAEGLCGSCGEPVYACTCPCPRCGLPDPICECYQNR